ncbi:MAG: leucine--tRNA ligase [Candidatus Nanoarchaeia archaeon]|nr:leucine--tRNA ligase [Candidatus Nanoarchaeia archaeon]
MSNPLLKIEKKWQKAWEEKKVFKTKEDPKKKKYYILEMFPYPSSLGLHMGHALNYTIGDIYARFKRMNNFSVLYPMGYDAFGLPAENAAIKAKEHPMSYTKKSIANFIKQQKALGLSYDWDRELITCEPEYYKWNQFFFLKLFENNLVYRKKSAVNWCPKCNTVLANEQVHNGKCWRHEDTDVEMKQLEQWFIKITKYAEELLDYIKELEWPDRIKTMQENWIGKSYGTEINFKINGKDWPIFTTRPDTIYGVTFMVISAQHPKLMELVNEKQKPEVEKFVKKLKSVSEKELEEMDKEGVFTGAHAINPVTNEKIPVYAGNFVIADYGSGMVMAVPTHDQRDFEFAKKYKIPMKVVIQPDDAELNADKMIRAYTGIGKLINSENFNGTSNQDAMEEITKYLESKKLGKSVVQYKLRDWLISRQRYWGTPIPMIYCDKCGIVPVPEKDLPVILPEKVKFGEGNPLLTNKEFVNVKCPKCKSNARRETDTMDTFFDSSWYFIRFADNKNIKEAFDRKKVDYWLPVDQYIGGAEHACMHLMYARFFVKALRDFNLLKFNEPFTRLFNQGMLHGADGQKMSKSLGNVINPIEMIDKYGADALRINLMSLASPDKDSVWSDKSIEFSFKFINKIKEYYENVKIGKSSERLESKLNKSIKEITEEIELFRYNIAIIKLRKLFESLSSTESKKNLESFLKILNPFCPHITEELWSKLGNKTFISLEKWPEVDESKINEKFEQEEQIIDNLVTDIIQVTKIIKEKQNKDVSKVFIYVIPKEKEVYETNKEAIKERINLDLEIYAVNDPKKHDPTGKAAKSKPGKPALFAE